MTPFVFGVIIKEFTPFQLNSFSASRVIGDLVAGNIFHGKMNLSDYPPLSNTTLLGPPTISSTLLGSATNGTERTDDDNDEGK